MQYKHLMGTTLAALAMMATPTQSVKKPKPSKPVEDVKFDARYFKPKSKRGKRRAAAKGRS